MINGTSDLFYSFDFDVLSHPAGSVSHAAGFVFFLRYRGNPFAFGSLARIFPILLDLNQSEVKLLSLRLVLYMQEARCVRQDVAGELFDLVDIEADTVVVAVKTCTQTLCLHYTRVQVAEGRSFGFL